MPEEVRLGIEMDRRWQRLHMLQLSACFFFLRSDDRPYWMSYLSEDFISSIQCEETKATWLPMWWLYLLFYHFSDVETVWLFDFEILKLSFPHKKKTNIGEVDSFFSFFLIIKQRFKDSNYSTIPALCLCLSKPSHSCTGYTGLMHELCKERKAEASWVDILILTVY